jgi:hypothetical protein
MIHELKLHPQYFQHVADGIKNFEIRRDDRNFQICDCLMLREYDVFSGYSGRIITREILYIYRGEYCKDGYCILSFKPKDLEENKNESSTNC